MQHRHARVCPHDSANPCNLIGFQDACGVSTMCSYTRVMCAQTHKLHTKRCIYLLQLLEEVPQLSSFDFWLCASFCLSQGPFNTHSTCDPARPHWPSKDKPLFCPPCARPGNAPADWAFAAPHISCTCWSASARVQQPQVSTRTCARQACADRYINTFTQICVPVYAYAYAYVCMYTCMYLCTHILTNCTQG